MMSELLAKNWWKLVVVTTEAFDHGCIIGQDGHIQILAMFLKYENQFFSQFYQTMMLVSQPFASPNLWMRKKNDD